MRARVAGYWIGWVAVVLAVPIVPFLFWGHALEARVEQWLHHPLPPLAVAGLVAGLLASDIFVPIPSSIVSTFGAAGAGFWLGTAASWVGMTAGSALGFAVARQLGRRAAARLSSAEELDRIDRLSRRYGPHVLVVTRPVPVLAEAAVLALGTSSLTWRAFLPPLMFSNLAVAAAYGAIGHLASPPLALAGSMALPLLLMVLFRRVCPPHAPLPPAREDARGKLTE